VAASSKSAFHWHADVVKAVVDRCREVGSGARNIDHVLTGSMLPELSTRLLARMAEGKPVESVHVSVAADTGVFRYDIA
jgi:type VI secretion system protein VasG